jgi:phage baseplate assembly protein W
MSVQTKRPFLGSGLGSPTRVDADGQLRIGPALITDATGKLQRAEYEDSVRQSIWLILATAKGERVMRPDFGCGIHDLVFETLTPGIAGRATTAVREALLRLEPRIDVREILVRPAGAGEILLISIDYEVRATNNVFNLVYPFYLAGSA